MTSLPRDEKTSRDTTSVSGRHLQFSREERKRWKLICPGSFNGSPVNVTVVAFSKAEAERVEVKLTPAVVAQELPLVFILSQGETRVGILRKKLPSASSPEWRKDWPWGRTAPGMIFMEQHVTPSHSWTHTNICSLLQGQHPVQTVLSKTQYIDLTQTTEGHFFSAENMLIIVMMILINNTYCCSYLNIMM